MDVIIRRIGSSLGIIIPKSRLVAWNLGEGDLLSISERGIAPRAAIDADEDKWRHALAVVGRFTPRQIRAKSLANLHRWKQAGAWVSAYENIPYENDAVVMETKIKTELTNRFGNAKPCPCK